MRRLTRKQVKRQIETYYKTGNPNAFAKKAPLAARRVKPNPGRPKKK